VAAQGRRIETEAAPIRYVAEPVDADTDSERAIRWLIALMVLCCDPLAIELTAAVSVRRINHCPASTLRPLGLRSKENRPLARQHSVFSDPALRGSGSNSLVHGRSSAIRSSITEAPRFDLPAFFR
jgi:hypothetical protein